MQVIWSVISQTAQTAHTGWGLALAMVGALTAVLLGGIGSAVGVGLAGRTATGVLAEDPDKFGRLFLLVALPGTQGFYGFIGGLFIILKVGILGTPKPVSVVQGWQFFFAALPVAISGLVSGIHQGKVAASGVEMAAKQPEASMKAVIYAAMVETYAVLGLLGTLFLLQGIKL